MTTRNKTGPVYWTGSPPTCCDVCKQPVGTMFIDGRTLLGPWAIMDLICHARFGCGLGTGRGQRYERQPDGAWLKVQG